MTPLWATVLLLVLKNLFYFAGIKMCRFYTNVMYSFGILKILNFWHYCCCIFMGCGHWWFTTIQYIQYTPSPFKPLCGCSLSPVTVALSLGDCTCSGVWELAPVWWGWGCLCNRLATTLDGMVPSLGIFQTGFWRYIDCLHL